jgi:hypothetical protein
MGHNARISRTASSAPWGRFLLFSVFSVFLGWPVPPSIASRPQLFRVRPHSRLCSPHVFLPLRPSDPCLTASAPSTGLSPHCVPLLVSVRPSRHSLLIRRGVVCTLCSSPPVRPCHVARYDFCGVHHPHRVCGGGALVSPPACLLVRRQGAVIRRRFWCVHSLLCRISIRVST